MPSTTSTAYHLATTTTTKGKSLSTAAALAAAVADRSTAHHHHHHHHRSNSLANIGTNYSKDDSHNREQPRRQQQYRGAEQEASTSPGITRLGSGITRQQTLFCHRHPACLLHRREIVMSRPAPSAGVFPRGGKNGAVVADAGNSTTAHHEGGRGYDEPQPRRRVSSMSDPGAIKGGAIFSDSQIAHQETKISRGVTSSVIDGDDVDTSFEVADESCAGDIARPPTAASILSTTSRVQKTLRLSSEQQQPQDAIFSDTGDGIGATVAEEPPVGTVGAARSSKPKSPATRCPQRNMNFSSSSSSSKDDQRFSDRSRMSGLDQQQEGQSRTGAGKDETAPPAQFPKVAVGRLLGEGLRENDDDVGAVVAGVETRQAMLSMTPIAARTSLNPSYGASDGRARGDRFSSSPSTESAHLRGGGTDGVQEVAAPAGSGAEAPRKTAPTTSDLRSQHDISDSMMKMTQQNHHDILLLAETTTSGSPRVAAGGKEAPPSMGTQQLQQPSADVVATLPDGNKSYRPYQQQPIPPRLFSSTGISLSASAATISVPLQMRTVFGPPADGTQADVDAGDDIDGASSQKVSSTLRAQRHQEYLSHSSSLGSRGGSGMGTASAHGTAVDSGRFQKGASVRSGGRRRLLKENGSSTAATPGTSLNPSATSGEGDYHQPHLSSTLSSGGVETTDDAHGSAGVTRPTGGPLPERGFSFSPAGLLLPYHLGVMTALMDFGYVTDETPLAGASAGGLAVMTAGAGFSMEYALQIFLKVEDDIRINGAPRRLHEVLIRELDEVMPADAHHILNTRKAPVTISHTTVLPYPRAQFPAHFHSREDLMECICASCNIPFYFSTWPTVTCRGKPSVDGYFAVPPKYFGCPTTKSRRTVRIAPFPASQVHLKHDRGDCVSPDLQDADEFLEEVCGAMTDLHAYLTGDLATPATRSKWVPEGYRGVSPEAVNAMVRKLRSIGTDTAGDKQGDKEKSSDDNGNAPPGDGNANQASGSGTQAAAGNGDESLLVSSGSVSFGSEGRAKSKKAGLRTSSSSSSSSSALGVLKRGCCRVDEAESVSRTEIQVVGIAAADAPVGIATARGGVGSTFNENGDGPASKRRADEADQSRNGKAFDGRGSDEVDESDCVADEYLVVGDGRRHRDDNCAGKSSGYPRGNYRGGGPLEQRTSGIDVTGAQKRNGCGDSTSDRNCDDDDMEVVERGFPSTSSNSHDRAEGEAKEQSTLPMPCTGTSSMSSPSAEGGESPRAGGRRDIQMGVVAPIASSITTCSQLLRPGFVVQTATSTGDSSSGNDSPTSLVNYFPSVAADDDEEANGLSGDGSPAAQTVSEPADPGEVTLDDQSDDVQTETAARMDAIGGSREGGGQQQHHHHHRKGRAQSKVKKTRGLDREANEGENTSWSKWATSLLPKKLHPSPSAPSMSMFGHLNVFNHPLTSWQKEKTSPSGGEESQSQKQKKAKQRGREEKEVTSLGEQSMSSAAIFEKVPKLRHSIPELLKYALNAADEDVIMELYNLGKADGFRWVKLEELGWPSEMYEPASVRKQKKEAEKRAQVSQADFLRSQDPDALATEISFWQGL